jgi:116 kDa U5 small nuclear ribonucleoprotein component
MLLDFTLPSETDPETLLMMKDYILQGYKWATREGPLCEETVRGVKFKIIRAQFVEEPVWRGGGQVIPMIRSGLYAAMLSASP